MNYTLPHETCKQGCPCFEKPSLHETLDDKEVCHICNGQSAIMRHFVGVNDAPEKIYRGKKEVVFSYEE